jgi:hypothetical protein
MMAAQKITDPAERLKYLQQKQAELLSGGASDINASNVSEVRRAFELSIAEAQKQAQAGQAQAAQSQAQSSTPTPAAAASSAPAPTSAAPPTTPSFTIPTPAEAADAVRQMPEVQKIQQAADQGLNFNNVSNYATQQTAKAYNPYEQAMANILSYKAPTPATSIPLQGMAELPNTSSKLGFDLGSYIQSQASNPTGGASLPAAPTLGSLPSAPSEVAMPTAPTLPGMTTQPDLAGIKNKNMWETSITPEVQGIMKALGRSGAESSSYADRLIGQMMSSEYAKWQDEIAKLELQRAQQEVADKLGIGQLAQQSFATKTSYANQLNQTRAQNYSTATSGAVGMANAAASIYSSSVSGAVGMANVEASRYATTVNAANQARSLEIQEALGLGELDVKRRSAANAEAIAAYTATMNANLQASELSLNAMTAALTGSIQGGASQINSTGQAMQNYMTPYMNQITAQLNTMNSMNQWYANQYAPLTTAMGTLGIGA